MQLKFPFYLFFPLLLATASCTDRVLLTEPSFSYEQTSPVIVSPPINVIVIDDREGKTNSEYAAELAQAIQSAYPQAISSESRLTDPVQGRVNIFLHINLLGAYFNQTKSSILSPNAKSSIVTGNIGDWNNVVSTITKEPVVAGSVYKELPGNWSGIVKIDINVRDLRVGHGANFTIPLMAERSRPNGLGYVEARLAADSAWDNINPKIISFLDAAVQKVSADRNTIN